VNWLLVGCVTALAFGCAVLVGIFAALVAGSRYDDDVLGDRQYEEDDDGYPPVGV
jgi:hypothetical protein